MVGRASLTADKNETMLPVDNVIVHENYDGNPVHGSDIALIKLAAPYTGSAMRLSGALSADPSDANGTNMYVAGFGKTESSGDVLRPLTTDQGNTARALSHVLKENYLPLFKGDCTAAKSAPVTPRSKTKTPAPAIPAGRWFDLEVISVQFSLASSAGEIAAA
jgi:hypothetical protein